MTKPKDSLLQDWLGAAFKSLIVCVVSMGVFVFNNLNKNVEMTFGALNKSIDSLNDQLKVMETEQVKFRAETDKRVSAIEVARQINMAGYEKLLNDVQEMKASMIQNTMRLNTIAEFVAKRSK